jgi:hypothetical protein
MALVASLSTVPAQASPSDYFSIRVVDDVTGRGVPLVELRTTNNVRYYTDSNGIAAVGDPEFMGQSVYFKITSPGYHVGKDSFGYTGTALTVKAGGKAIVKITRDNIAERLYRITGAGIYRDSVLTGAPVPIKHPLLNGLVTGQDTVEVTPYKGKLYWFFGDTDRPSFPLGQFGTSGATSELPGLDPSKGIDLTYWVGKDGFSRPMIPLPNASGPVWIAGLFTMPDGGVEHLYTFFAEVDHAMKPTLTGLARFNDDKAVFEPIHTYENDNALRPEGHPFFATENGAKYIYFQPPRMGAYPLTRTTPDLKHITDPTSYEAFTCLAPGARYEGENSRLDRDASGKLVWAWKRNTQPLGIDQVKDLVSKGKLKADEALAQLRDVQTDEPVMSHGGSVFWNAHRHRWIMITTQAFGSPSFLGEVWFAEADTPVGPWTYARKVATHNHYTYYNPTQHPFFDQDGGRLIYFEGTYVDTFSDVKDITPRYNYNQLMYRVDLNDPRLALPAPVYEVATGNGVDYAMREQVSPKHIWSKIQAIPFYAVPPRSSPAGLVAVYAANGRLGTDKSNTMPLFYALPPAADAKEKASPSVTPLYEYKDQNGRYRYSTSADLAGLTRSPPPLCRVWRNLSSVLALDGEAVAAPSAGK